MGSTPILLRHPHARPQDDGRTISRTDVLLNEDAFGHGWTGASAANWQDKLTTGQAVAPAFAAWVATEAYKGRAG